MSMNPFDDQLIPFGYELALLDRSADFRLLDSRCSGKRILNYRYISPRGLGKTALLDAYFTEERCKKLASNEKKLVRLCRFSGDEMRSDADVFVRLIEAVRGALENLDESSEEFRLLSHELGKKIREKPDHSKDANKGEELLKDMLNCLKREGYFVTLVLDEFHQLACAKGLADTTFSKMAAIEQANLISYIVASDYDDSVGSETYYISPFSRIFANSTSHLKGITSPAGKKALVELIRSKLVYYPEVTFTDEELGTLLDLTGGIPGLLQDALRDLFEIKLEESCILTPQEVAQYALSACTPLMEKWVQYFDDARWETMEAVLEEVKESAIKNRLSQARDKKRDLGDAGLIVKNIRRQEYRAICPLFAVYIQEELRRRKGDLAPVPIESWGVVNEVFKRYLPQGGAQAATGPVVFIGRDIYTNGAKNESKTFESGATDMSSTVNVLNQGISTSDLLQLLSGQGPMLGDGTGDSRGLFASQLAEQLRRYIPSGQKPLLLRDPSWSDEEYEQIYDAEFEKLSRNVVQDVAVDEEEDVVATPAELKTLEMRFAEARARCRTDLTDEMLNAQSERCQFYIKLSVVVEDALTFPGIKMEDYSPQLVLYGKALEQSLRDNFFELFHREERLSVYDTYKRREDKLSLDTFSKKQADQTMIGNYTCLMFEQKEHLAELCQANSISIQPRPVDKKAWGAWWTKLQKDISDARKIRNLADHAAPVSPDKDKLDQMCQLLFGEAGQAGVLDRSIVGKRLGQNMFPPSISFEVIQRYRNNTCRVQCTAVKTNGGIKAVTCEGGYAVNVSAKRVRAFRTKNNCEELDLTGKELIVKVLDCMAQDGKEFFAAEIDSIPSIAG